MTTARQYRDLPTWPGPVTPADILREKFDPTFVELIKNRMVVGTFRYTPGRSIFDPDLPHGGFGAEPVAKMREKLDEFARTRNHEALVDLATYCMLLFRLDEHPRAHFAAQDQGLTEADVEGRT